MNNITKQELIDFEKKIGVLFEEGELPFLMHFCGGNEDALIDLFSAYIMEGDYILSTHRNHYHYLLAGGKTDDLENKIRNGDSMFVFNRKLNFLSTSILAGGCGIAAGIALSLKTKNSPNYVWCFLGDGAEDEGHLYEAVKFVESNKLPCIFVVEDNDRSVETNKKERGSSYIMNWPECVLRYQFNSTYPHAGTGTSKIIKFKNIENFIK